MAAQVLAPADRALLIGGELEDVGDQNVAAGPERRFRLCQRLIRLHEEEAFAEQDQVVSPIQGKLLELGFEDPRPVPQHPASLRGEPGIGRHAVDLVAPIEQLERRVPRAAAHVQNRAHVRRNVGHQLVGVAGLGPGHVLRRQLQIVGPVPVMQVLHIEGKAPEHKPEGESEFGRLERGLAQRGGHGVG